MIWNPIGPVIAFLFLSTFLTSFPEQRALTADKLVSLFAVTLLVSQFVTVSASLSHLRTVINLLTLMHKLTYGFRI